MSKIMVIDDDPAGQRLIKLMLSAEGHEVTAASNGIQGLQTATEMVPDLIILDVMLPGLDGFEVCRRLRAGAKTARIPVIMLSGKTQASDRETGLKMGADAYLIKPVDRKEMVEVTNRLLHEIPENKATRARLVAFMGTRGGAGTTTVAINVAVSLAGEGHETILVDLNPSFSAVPDLLGLESDTTVSGLFKGAAGTLDTDKLKESLISHSSGVRVLSGDQLSGEFDDFTPGNMESLLLELSTIAEYVIIDIPASASDLNISALSACDTVVMVSGAAPDSKKRLESSVSRLSRLGVDRKKFALVVVDRTGSGIDSSLTAPDGTDGLPVLGTIRSDPGVLADAEASGTPVVSAAPSSPSGSDLRDLAKKIADRR